jgi:hypothetical protein
MKQRQAVTAVTVRRYRNGSKKIKQQILDEFCETTGYCRGYARFVLRNHGRQVWLGGKRVIVGDVHQRRQRQKPRYYNEAIVQELVKLWELLNYSCGKRLVAIMPELIAKLDGVDFYMRQQAGPRQQDAVSYARCDSFALVVRPSIAECRVELPHTDLQA